MREVEAIENTESDRSSKGRRDNVNAFFYKVAECLLDKGLDRRLVANTKARSEFIDKCDNDIITMMKDQHEFTYNIGTAHPMFKFHERVRIDEVKVYQISIGRSFLL